MDRSTSPSLDTAVSRRRLLTSLVIAPAAGILFAACGDDTVDGPGAGNTPGSDVPTPSADTPTGIAHPTGPDDVILRYGYEGGFVPVGTAFVNLPNLLVTGDGRVFRPGAITLQYPGPLVAPMTVRTISEAGIQRLLSLANESGLLAPPPDYSIEAMVTDVGDTVVTFSADGGTFEHRAYALEIEDAGRGNEAARENLGAYVRLLGDLETTVGAEALGAEEIVVPTAYRFQAYPSDESGVSETEPAPTFVDWPASAGVRLADATECAVVEASAIGDLFETATQLTYFREDGQVYALAVAVVLPGDPVC